MGNNMKFLVTGGCGYIGSLLVKKLSEIPDSKVRILDNMFRERFCSLWSFRNIKNVEFIDGDIRNKEDVKKAMKGIDIVFDLAGITNAPLSFKRKKLTREVIYYSMDNLLNEAKKANIKKYIYTSTASVYGPTTGIVTEKSKCKPISPYGRYKYMAERKVIKFGKKHNLNTTVLRLGTVYGWTIGSRYDSVVINKFVYYACIGKKLTIYKNALKEKRPYINVKDVVRAYLFVFSHPKITKHEVYNIVGQNFGIQDVVKRIKKFIPNLKTEITKSPDINQLSYEVDGSKIAKIGFRPKYSMEDGIKSIIKKFG